VKKAQTSAKGRKTTASKVSRRARARAKRSSRAAVRGTARKAAARRARKPSKRPRVAKAVARAAKPLAPSTPPLLRKGLPVSKASLRRPAKHPAAGPRPETKSIIVYTNAQRARNDYPKRIISPPLPSVCCTDANRVRIGKIYEELGRNYYYKMCKVCGHTVKYYFNLQSDLDSPKFRKYYEWKKSVFH
jgi:hypothetical protein